MAETAYIALVLALVASFYSAIAFALGRRPAVLRSAQNGLVAVFGLVSLSVLILLIALLSHSFGLEYVASYTSRDTSLVYLVSALWAGNSGSLLLWAWLTAMCAVVAFFARRDDRRLVPYASAVIMLTQAFFLLLLVVVANPFRALPNVPPDGSGLNPMLENPGMIFHPPALLAGYVVLTVPFAFAIASLLAGRLTDEWLASIRRWVLAAWLLLGIGLLIGAWWAYVELGWGGYWAWDAVENAGLMPWLVVTAFLHSLMMQRRHGIFKMWNMVLIVLAFILAVFGTFLTRSGIVSSVHTFSESGLGPFFLVFLGLVTLGSLGLLYYRSDMLRSEAEIDSLLSRESASLLNNLLLVGSTLIILFGTLLPALSDAVLGARVSVGAAFFNEVTVPVFLAIVLLIGFCALVGWRRSAPKDLVRRSAPPLAAGLLVGIVLIIAGVTVWYALVAFAVSALVLLAVVLQWRHEVGARRRARTEGHVTAFWTLLRGNPQRYGGYLVHIGIVLTAIGIIASSVYAAEEEASLSPGQSMSIRGYTLTYENLENFATPSKTVVSATLAVSRDGKPLGKLTPEKYFHRSYEQPVTEVAIRTTLVEDLYVILVGQDGRGGMAFKVLVNPAVVWVWIGGTVAILGGLVACFPGGRRRRAPVRVESPVAVEDEIEKRVAALRQRKG